MSLDVEGSEMEILRAFPFEQYCVRFSTIETNNDEAKERELRAFMLERGYTFLGHAGVDDYFAFATAEACPEVPFDGFDPPLEYTVAT